MQETVKGTRLWRMHVSWQLAAKKKEGGFFMGLFVAKKHVLGTGYDGILMSVSRMYKTIYVACDASQGCIH